MLSDEADAGTLGEIAFENRAGVHIPEGAGIRTAEIVNECGERLEFVGQNVVVVGITGVAGDFAGLLMADGRWLIGEMIAGGGRLRCAHWVGTSCGSARLAALRSIQFISHGAFPEAGLGTGPLGPVCRSGEAASVKTERARLLADGLFHFRIWVTSRN